MSPAPCRPDWTRRIVLAIILLLLAPASAQDWLDARDRGRALISQQPEQAVEILLGALELALEQKGEEDIDTCLIRGFLGQAYFALEDYARAIKEFEICQPLLAQEMPQAHAQLLLWQGRAHYNSGDSAGFIKCAERALDLFDTLDANIPELYSYYQFLSREQSKTKQYGGLGQTARRFSELLESGVFPDATATDVQEIGSLAYQADKATCEKLLLQSEALAADQKVDDNFWKVGKSWLALAQSWQDKNKEAIASYESLLSYLQGPEDRALLAQSRVGLGGILVEEQRWAEALPHLQLVEEVPEGLLRSQGLAKLGDVYRYLGQDELAVDCFSRAMISAEEKHKVGFLSQRSMCLLAIGRPEEAMADIDLALKLQGDTDGEERANNLNRKARMLLNMGRGEEALSVLKEATEALQNSEGPGLGLVLANTARALFNQGDYLLSLKVGDRAIRHLIESGSLDRALALTRSDQARRYLALGYLDKARIELEQSAELYLKSLGPRNPETIQVALLTAEILSEYGEVKKCLELVEPTIPLLEEVLGPNDFRLGRAHIALASLLERDNRQQEALEHLYVANSIFADDSFQKALVLGDIALLEMREGSRDKAYANGQAAATMSLEQGPKNSLSVLYLLDFAAGLSLERYRANADRQDLLRAQKWLDLALERSRSTRELVDDRSRREQSLHLVDLYPRAVEVAAAKGETERALELAELAVSRALLELIAGTQRPSAEREEMRSLLDTVGVDLSMSGSSGVVETLTSQQLRAVLRPNEIVLYILLGPGVSHGFLVDSETITYFPLPGREKIEPPALALAQQLATGRVRAKILGEVKVQEKERLELGRLLWDAIPQERLQDTKGKTLVIVPTGHLLEVPFEALPALPGDPGRFLVESHAVYYAPSLSLLGYLRERPKRKTLDRTLVVANPVYGGAAGMEVASRYRAQDSSLSFAPLPYTQVEAESIVVELGAENCDLWVAEEANEDKLQSTDLTGYRILHFACHGILGRRRGLPPALVLSQGDHRGSTDGFLTMDEVSAMDPPLQSDLVVLSACQTGRGYFQAGEGVEGMARSFLRSGAQAVLVSLWTVDDRSTSKLMTHFYRYLKQDGLRPAEALHKAQLDMISSGVPPGHWAPFILMGDDREIF